MTASPSAQQGSGGHSGVAGISRRLPARRPHPSRRRARRRQDRVRAGLRAGGSASPSTSPARRSPSSTATTGDACVNHVDVYRLERLREVTDLGLAEMLDEGVTLIEWGDAVRPHCPATSSRSASPTSKTTTTLVDSRSPLVGPSGWRGTSRRGATALERLIVLILGIETATHRSAGHRRARGRDRARSSCRAGGATPRRSSRRSSSCASRRGSTLDEFGAVAVDVGPGPLHRLSGRPRRGEGDGPGAARADDRDLSLDLLALPASVHYRADRRGDRRSPWRGLLRLATERSQAGCSACAAPCRYARRSGRGAGRHGPRHGAGRRRRSPLPSTLEDLRRRRARRPAAGPSVGGVARAAAHASSARGVGQRRASSSRSTSAGPTPRSTGTTRERPDGAPPRMPPGERRADRRDRSCRCAAGTCAT